MRCLIAMALAGLGAIGAQQHLDFSGHWVLTSPAADAGTPREMSIKQWSMTVTLLGERQPTALDISVPGQSAAGRQTTTFRQVDVSTTYSFACSTADPKCHTFGDSSTRLEGDKLVFSTRTYTGRTFRTGAWTERREVWAIAPDGTLVIEITTDSWKSAPHTLRSTYARQ